MSFGYSSRFIENIQLSSRPLKRYGRETSKISDSDEGGAHSTIYRTTKNYVIKKIDKKDNFEFIRELAALTLLNHPHIIPLIDLGLGKKSYNLVLPAAEHSLHSGTSMPLRSVIYQILTALSYCHGRGIIHRDIKRDNILEFPGGIIKLADFGASRYLNCFSHPELTVDVFAPLYKAPEVILSESAAVPSGSGDETDAPLPRGTFGGTEEAIDGYSFASDVWAAGVTIFELAASTVPSGTEGGKDFLDYEYDRTNFSTLEAIFRVKGTPSKNNWPEAREYIGWPSYLRYLEEKSSPQAPSAVSNLKKYRLPVSNYIRDRLQDLSEKTISLNLLADLLEDMTILDPQLRPGAYEILQIHADYFGELKTPALEMLPNCRLMPQFRDFGRLLLEDNIDSKRKLEIMDELLLFVDDHTGTRTILLASKYIDHLGKKAHSDTEDWNWSGIALYLASLIVETTTMPEKEYINYFGLSGQAELEDSLFDLVKLLNYNLLITTAYDYIDTHFDKATIDPSYPGNDARGDYLRALILIATVSEIRFQTLEIEIYRVADQLSRYLTIINTGSSADVDFLTKYHYELIKSVKDSLGMAGFQIRIGKRTVKDLKKLLDLLPKET